MPIQWKKLAVSCAAAPVLMLANAAMPAYAADYVQWGKGNVPKNSYGECWMAVDGIKGCGEAKMMMPKDSDGDGVTDDKDRCPTTPAGVKVDGNGCALDSDGDGVADYKDKCPNSHAGAKVNADGCELDSDADGVIDSHDACPNTPAGATVDGSGCMAKIVLNDVLFDTNKAILKDGAMATLNKVAEMLKARPDVNSLMVTGHTDSRGDDGYNMDLSEKRAQAVADYLSGAGVSASMSTMGKGESMPATGNDTAAGRAANRRVEISVK